MEYCLQRSLLNSEKVCIIRIEINSINIGNMNRYKFRRLQNRRIEIEHEISKLLNINIQSIELLRPIQLKNGVNLTFHIRSGASESKTILNIIKKESQNGHLAKVT